jgi:hypothetical protein
MAICTAQENDTTNYAKWGCAPEILVDVRVGQMTAFPGKPEARWSAVISIIYEKITQGWGWGK